MTRGMLVTSGSSGRSQSTLKVVAYKYVECIAIVQGSSDSPQIRGLENVRSHNSNTMRTHTTFHTGLTVHGRLHVFLGGSQTSDNLYWPPIRFSIQNSQQRPPPEIQSASSCGPSLPTEHALTAHALPLVITPTNLDHKNLLGKQHWRAVSIIKHCQKRTPLK